LVLVAVNLIAAHALETADLDRLRRRSSRTVIVGTIPQDALPDFRARRDMMGVLERATLVGLSNDTDRVGVEAGPAASRSANAR
jgi:hypothetical protein